MSYKIIPGDSLEVLKTFEEDSIDSLITDPPAGIGFMGKHWDTADTFQVQMRAIFVECLRVLKPGAHGLVWALPKTSHWTATALEEAGFEIRDVITHVFGSGFPKSRNVSIEIDKKIGGMSPRGTMYQFSRQAIGQEHLSTTKTMPAHKPITDEAKEWEGWGTALKPASEHWILVRKPFGASNIAENFLEYGVGGINIAESRIGTTGGGTNCNNYGEDGYCKGHDDDNDRLGTTHHGYVLDKGPSGRFPANFMLSHRPGCEKVGTREDKVEINRLEEWSGFGQKVRPDYESETRSSVVDVYECVPGCVVQELNEQSGVSTSTGGKNSPGAVFGTRLEGKQQTLNIGGLGDTGGASRFFYCAKPSKAERNAGCETFPDKEFDINTPNPEHRQMSNKNIHPTVKPVKLMRYLCRLITPKGGTVLDPFLGSGTTGIAAIQEDLDFTGIEREPEYVEVSQARLKEADYQHRGKQNVLFE